MNMTTPSTKQESSLTLKDKGGVKKRVELFRGI